MTSRIPLNEVRWQSTWLAGPPPGCAPGDSGGTLGGVGAPGLM